MLSSNFFNYVTFSPSRSVRCETKKPPAMRVCVEGYTQKNSKRDTIKVFKPIVKRKEKNMAQKAHSLSHTKWHFSITLCSPLSINEKSSIINIEVAYHIRITKKFKRMAIFVNKAFLVCYNVVVNY